MSAQHTVQTPSYGRVVTYDQWCTEGELRFGPQRAEWQFICPSCGKIAKAQDWLDAGAPAGQIAFSCIGRSCPDTGEAFPKEKHGRGCNYAGGGLFPINPVGVVFEEGGTVHFFDFAPDGKGEEQVAA